MGVVDTELRAGNLEGSGLHGVLVGLGAGAGTCILLAVQSPVASLNAPLCVSALSVVVGGCLYGHAWWIEQERLGRVSSPAELMAHRVRSLRRELANYDVQHASLYWVLYAVLSLNLMWVAPMMSGIVLACAMFFAYVVMCRLPRLRSELRELEARMGGATSK